MGIFTSLFGGDTATKAAKKSLEEAKNTRRLALGDIEPYAAAGTNALQDYLDAIGLGDSAGAVRQFEGSPDYMLNYERALDEGRRGVSSVAYGSGKYNSGARLKALQDRGVDISRGYFGDYTNRLQGVAGMGQQAAGAKANIRTGMLAPIQQGYSDVATAKLSTLAGFDSLLNYVADNASKAAGAYLGAGGSFGGGKPASPTPFSQNAFMPAYGPQRPYYA